MTLVASGYHIVFFIFHINFKCTKVPLHGQRKPQFALFGLTINYVGAKGGGCSNGKDFVTNCYMGRRGARRGLDPVASLG